MPQVYDTNIQDYGITVNLLFLYIILFKFFNWLITIIIWYNNKFIVVETINDRYTFMIALKKKSKWQRYQF